MKAKKKEKSGRLLLDHTPAMDCYLSGGIRLILLFVDRRRNRIGRYYQAFYVFN
jgi:hypothetical protein